ncbi:unnamed protein product [Adineta steineri]|uniref:Uncharacterized protein n=1 Tax=Adineta steineri TaxID=433720 RepID=A0A818MTP2_9BILA|nr:unnamed protein product [Adineta steineri]
MVYLIIFLILLATIHIQQATAYQRYCVFDTASCDEDSDCCPGCTCRYGNMSYADALLESYVKNDFNVLLDGGVCGGNNGPRSCPICVASGEVCTADGLDCCYGTCTNGRCYRITNVCYFDGFSCYDFDNNCAIGGNYPCYDPDRRYANTYPITIGCCLPDGTDATKPQTINGKVYTTVAQCKSGLYDGFKKYCRYS